MKKFLFSCLLITMIGSYFGHEAYAQYRVNGYTRSNGTYVAPYYRATPNNTNHDNYSTLGNRNPYTGQTGYRARDYSSGSFNYGQGNSIQTGPRGGQYYQNSNGRKVYIPKRF